MKNVKNVFLFEYLGAVKLKSFLVTMIIVAIVSAGFAFLPTILDFADGMFGGDDAQVTREIAVIDNTGLFTDQLLAQHLNAVFHRGHSDIDTITTGIEAGDYDLGVVFMTPTEYMLVFETNLTGPLYMNTIRSLVLEQYVATQFGQVGLDALSAEVTSHFVPVGGGGFFVGYILAFIVFMIVQLFGAGIGVAIVQEKTTKVVEVLFTSATPREIVIGKVAAYIAVTATFLIVAFAPYLLISAITGENAVATMLSPEILNAFSPVVIFAIIAFLFIYLISILFLYAMFSATAKDAQEAQQVQMVPSLIHTAALMLAIFGVAMNPDWMTSTLLDILGFIPVLAPMSMVVRITSLSAPDAYIIASVVANFVYMLALGGLATWMYARFIMYNGAKPFKNLFKGNA